MIGGIYQQYVVEFEFCFFQCCVDDINWFLFNIRWEEIDVDLFGQGFQLFDCCWVVNVCGNDQYFFFVFFVQEFFQFIDVGGFISILQVCYQYYGWWLCCQVECLVFFVYCCYQFVVDDFDEFLIWGQVFIDFMVDCVFFDVVDEIMDYWKCNVCFQQCYVYFVQGVFNIVFCKVFVVVNVVQCM